MEYKKLLSDIESTEELLKTGDSDIRELAQAELDEIEEKEARARKRAEDYASPC